ncbi:MAG: hypothetical protein F4Y02_16955 [Chloroflexi bacterium]|nr:hypothetical protein [Chloroflexota bacterium]
MTKHGRIRIFADGPNSVRRIIPAGHPLAIELDPDHGDERDVVEDYWCPPTGGYVHRGIDATGPQVCNRLASGGRTLQCRAADDLLPLIRQQSAAQVRETGRWGR